MAATCNPALLTCVVTKMSNPSVTFPFDPVHICSTTSSTSDVTLPCPNKQYAFFDSIPNLSPPLLQLRYLQTLNSIAAEHNSTIIFPMPINLATRLFGRSSAAAEAEEEEAEEEEKGKGGAPKSSALSAAGQE